MHATWKEGILHDGVLGAKPVHDGSRGSSITKQSIGGDQPANVCGSLSSPAVEFCDEPLFSLLSEVRVLKKQ